MALVSLLPVSLQGRLQPLIGRDEERIVLDRGGNPAALCNELVTRSLARSGASLEAVRTEVEALLVHERDLALVELRRVTFGDRLTVELSCGECNGTYEVTIDLDRLTRPAPVEAQLAFEVHGQRVLVRLPTAGDQARVIALDGDLELRRDALLAATLLALGDRGGPFTVDDVQGLTPQMRAAIDGAVEAALPDIDLALTTQCPDCTVAIEAPVQLAQLVLGELRERSKHLFREVHLLAREYHWSEREILRLSVPRRRKYLALIDADRDAAHLAGAMG